MMDEAREASTYQSGPIAQDKSISDVVSKPNYARFQLSPRYISSSRDLAQKPPHFLSPCLLPLLLPPLLLQQPRLI